MAMGPQAAVSAVPLAGNGQAPELPVLRGREQTTARVWNGQKEHDALYHSFSFSKKLGRRDMLHKEIQHIFTILRS